MTETKERKEPKEPKDAALYMIVGKNGRIGNKLAELLTQQGKKWQFMEARLEARDDVVKELDLYHPTFVFNNVDLCEDPLMKPNVIDLLTLCDLTNARGIHMTNFVATGYCCDTKHRIATETDAPNFDGCSFYSFRKSLVEKIITRVYKQVLTLRLGMPISDDLFDPSTITKNNNNIPNSMTILSDMLPIVIEAAERRLTGVFNFTNPGAIFLL